MQIWRDVDDVPADLGRTVVSIGNFDGVHLGHAHVLREARATAQRLGIDTVVAVTFDPHPMAVLRPEHAPPTLTSVETRSRLLESAGVDSILVVGFDREIASWTPQDFIDRIALGDFWFFAWDARGHGRSPGERGLAYQSVMITPLLASACRSGAKDTVSSAACHR